MMEKIWKRYNALSNRFKTSIYIASVLIGLISTIMSILGVSLNDWTHKCWLSLVIILAAFFGLLLFSYWIIGRIFKDSVSLIIRQTPVFISYGDIFDTEGFRLVGCDTHFDIRIDDIVISKKSLHGRLVLEHGNAEEIEVAVKNEAQKLHLSANSDGSYNFPLGTIIRYDSSVDQKTYLMLAMTELDENYKSHTNMAKFEQMLMKMWSEIDRVYSSNDVVLPLLGTGISRFDDGPKDKEALLRCMLCTLNSSGVTLNSKVKVIVFDESKDIPLYEYNNMFKIFQER